MEQVACVVGSRLRERAGLLESVAEDDHSHFPQVIRRSGGELADEGLVVEVPRKVEIVRMVLGQLGSPSSEQEVGILAAEVGGDRLTDAA
ncbi:hypothetical protein GCM10027074_73470 [Streptomyces deserti]